MISSTICDVRAVLHAATGTMRAEVAVARATLLISKMPADASYSRKWRTESRLEEAVRERDRQLRYLREACGKLVSA